MDHLVWYAIGAGLLGAVWGLNILWERRGRQEQRRTTMTPEHRKELYLWAAALVLGIAAGFALDIVGYGYRDLRVAQHGYLAVLGLTALAYWALRLVRLAVFYRTPDEVSAQQLE